MSFLKTEDDAGPMPGDMGAMKGFGEKAEDGKHYHEGKGKGDDQRTEGYEKNGNALLRKSHALAVSSALRPARFQLRPWEGRHSTVAGTSYASGAT